MVAAVGVSAACGVSTSIASSLLTGVAVVDARAFFLGGIVLVRRLRSCRTNSIECFDSTETREDTVWAAIDHSAGVGT